MTKDDDFKALVRARMAKTGESYTTARERLLQQRNDHEGAEAVEPAASRNASQTRFTLGSDPSAIGANRRYVEDLFEATGVVVEAQAVRVWMGDPPMFEIVIPRDAVQRVEPVPDRPPGSSLGAQGMRGRWLVNAAYVRLVRLTLRPPVRATLRVGSSIPDEVRGRTPLLLRPLLRDRAPKVRELTISVDDPEAFVAALR